MVIPVYRPDEKFLGLMEMLHQQSVTINRFILMHTVEDGEENVVGVDEDRVKAKNTVDLQGIAEDRSSDFSLKITNQYPTVEIYPVSKKEFDHGHTRNLGIEKSDADVFICMTQDAMPADGYMVENLLKVLESEEVAVAYGMQLP
ncbi:MAG: glycosyltransferase family A protein, partial [Eubacteriales bacterium]